MKQETKTRQKNTRWKVSLTLALYARLDQAPHDVVAMIAPRGKLEIKLNTVVGLQRQDKNQEEERARAGQHFDRRRCGQLLVFWNIGRFVFFGFP